MTPDHPTAIPRFLLFLLLCLTRIAPAQNQPQRLVFAGLRSAASQGQFNAVRTDAAGNLYLLLDQKDGVRLLKTDNAAASVLAQAYLGAKGDIGLAMALDPYGNVYVTGTSTSSKLAGTSGAAFPNPTDASTNSFVARFDSNLNLQWLSFTGASRIAAASLAVTADAVFVTGTIFSDTLPVTSSAIQQSPAYASSENGFVERLSSDGSMLVYATYLTGSAGGTSPTSIAADAADNAYIVGSTSSPGYPTIAAVVPEVIGTSNASGFLTRLTPAGDAITFSTYIPGNGLTGLTLDATGQNLLLTGNVDLGDFPVDTVSAPVAGIAYQSLVRMPLNGGSVISSTLLAPGTQSFAAPAPDGSIWIDGTLTSPLLPIPTQSPIGQSFAVHLNAQGLLDQTARFGGLPTSNLTFASVPVTLTSLAVDAAGEPVVAGSAQPGASSSLLATETYDLPLRSAPTATLPSSIHDAVLSATSCTGSLCAGSAAYLAKLNTSDPAPALTFSSDDAPLLTLRNLGSIAATGLQITSSGAALTSNCPSTLYAGSECSALVTGSGTVTVTAAADNSPAQSTSITAQVSPPSTLVFSPKEMDFGLQTSTNTSAIRSITISNIGQQAETFVSQLDSTAKPLPTTFTQTTTDCVATGTANSYTLAAGGSCHIALAFHPSNLGGSDGPEQALWLIGSRDLLLTGFQQAAALSVSTSGIDFGTQYVAGLMLPRYLYLSNPSGSAIPHATVTLSAPFSIVDHCPASLAPNSVCQLKITYASTQVPASDSTSLTLDQGLSVLVSGRSLPQPGTSGSTVNPNLSVSPAAVTFATAVPVTSVSGETQTVTIANQGTASFPLSLVLTGDFIQTSGCGASLAGNSTCTVVLAFAPSQPGTRTGLLAVTAGAGTTPAYLALTGTATSILPANNGTLDQGSTPVGQPSIQWYKVSQSFGTLSAATTGPYTAVLVEDIGYGHGQPSPSAFSMQASGTCFNCFLGIRFIPPATGSQTGVLALSSTPSGNPYQLTLTGSGLPLSGLSLTPLSQAFGIIPVGSTSASSLFTVTNLSASGEAITLAPPTLTGPFALSTAPTGGPACGGTLAYLGSCFLQINLTPTTTGPQSGTLMLNGDNLTAISSLTGFAPADPGLSLSPTSLTFTNLPGSTATQQTIQLTNTGQTSLQVGSPATSLSSFQVSTTCGTLLPATSCTLTVTFLPGSATVTDTLQIPVTQSSGGAAPAVVQYTVPLTGVYTVSTAGLQILPAATQFGPVTTGTSSSSRQVTINNLTGRNLNPALDIPRQFVLTSAPCTSIQANASCTVSLSFVPLTNGDIPGTLSALGLPVDGSPNLTGIGYLEGYGTGSATLGISGNLLPGNVLTFGQVTSGQSASQTITFTNKSANPLTIRRLTSQPPFLTTSTCGAVLTQSQSCTASITYTPVNQVATGTTSPTNTIDSGTLTIESDALSSPDTLLLSGQAGPLAVTSPTNSTPLVTYTLSQGSLTFPPTTVGNLSPPQTLVLTNTGTATIQILSASTTSDFTLQSACTTLAPAATCSMTVSFTPQAAGQHLSAIEIASSASNSLEFVSLSGIGGASSLVLNPSTLDFGSVLVNTRATQIVTATNSGTIPINFQNIAVVPATAGYTSGGSCPPAGSPLAPGASCNIGVFFTPATIGPHPATLNVATDISTFPLTVALTGSGIESQLQVAPSALAFGNLVVGASANLALTLVNLGSAPITSLAMAVTGDYAVTIPCPVARLVPGASCFVQITFTPTAVGSRPGTVSIFSSDPSSPRTIPLTGTGIAAGSFTLTVDGSSQSAAIVKSGLPATFTLAVIPQFSYGGSVALTCAPVVPAQYATCSIAAPIVTLAGATQTTTVTLNTVTEIASAASLGVPGLIACLLLPGIFMLGYRRRSLLCLVLLLALLPLGSCGGNITLVASTNSNLRYTPPGTYQYTVTASSISGVQITQTITLNLTVQ